MRTKCVRAAWSFALCLSVALTACDDENNENDGPVVPPPVDESIDLTASEAYANCFIVTEADEYRFATRKVDGSDVEGIVSVDWLWSTKNAAGNPLVSEVSYKDGIVHFTSDGTEGNTVLAAFDAKGEVIWSWHLWMTDQPELFAYDEGGELMDRNLGATSALEADGAASFGLLYQWGRKDPFYGGRAGRHGSLCDGAPDNLPFQLAQRQQGLALHRRGRLVGQCREEDELRSMSRRLPGAGSGRMGQYLLVQRGRRAEQRRQVLYDGLRCEDLVPALRPSLGRQGRR